ncbi:M61 family metallopeptidase [Uliginosibacterium sp. sgz301328]|uniref:M61 family metallopeptidase n=1 Tax=Uliginosibacterium sp. sgz301328 TaxID=3243764 RepID=UPI00359E154C
MAQKRTQQAIQYTVEAHSPSAHIFRVTLTLASPAPAGESFMLPSWIPGSYMIREFARNIVTVRAMQGRREIVLVKDDKDTWRTQGKLDAATPLVVVYDVYAWDLSVRCAHLDDTHGFFNGTQLFLRVVGRESQAHVVDIRRPQGARFRDWCVATTLPRARGAGAAPAYGFGLYRAADYDELVDHPVEMGTFELIKFKAHGVPHEVAVTGRVRFDAQRLARDLQRICEWHIDLFGQPAPFSRYLFLVMAVGDGYGGLEHRDSTALICSRNDLPVTGVADTHERYRTFLGLCSHEYFHSWNVKRIQPAAFRPYRLNEENYTRLLWVFEGFTSYYDDIALVRNGLISRDEYLALLAKTIAGVERGTGRTRQSVAESSFEAWTKYYRQDENSPNAIVSYYTKGSLVAAGLDLTIRAATRGRKSLDDVMRHLWNAYALGGRSVAEGEMPAIVEAATGVDVRRQILAWAEGTEDVPLDKLLASFGVTLTRKRGGLSSGLGMKTKAENGTLKLASVLDDGSLQRAGASAGDELVALDGLRVTGNNLDVLLTRYQPGDSFELTLFRRDELQTRRVTLDAPRVEECTLAADAKAAAATRRLRDGWLGTE